MPARRRDVQCRASQQADNLLVQSRPNKVSMKRKRRRGSARYLYSGGAASDATPLPAPASWMGQDVLTAAAAERAKRICLGPAIRRAEKIFALCS